MDTIYIKPKDFERKWYIVDATGLTLGRVATKVAYVLAGKNKAHYVPYHECGDYVIIINAEKIVVTGRKADGKVYYQHSRHPGGLKTYTFAKMLQRRPEYPLEQAVRGMLPKTRLGRKLFTNLKVYVGSNHPHSAQQPQPLEI